MTVAHFSANDSFPASILGLTPQALCCRPLRPTLMPNPYDQIAEQWHSHNRAFREQKFVDMTLQGLTPGARVLDFGCGTGAPIAQYLVQRGFRVVGIDGSEKMLEIARRVVPEATLICGDMLELEIDGQFSAVIAWDSIFHLERTQHQAIFRKLYNALESGGRLLLSAGGSGVEGCTSEMYGHTFFYSGHEPEVTLDLLRTAGFKIDFWEVDEPSSKGHIAVVATRCQPQIKADDTDQK